VKAGDALRLSERNRLTFVARHGETLKARHFPPTPANRLAVRETPGAQLESARLP
jgi:hypothetical protein